MSLLGNIRDAISDEAALLAKIHKAKDDAPTKIENSELPILWTELGSISYSQYAYDIVEGTIQAKIIVAVSAKTTGLNQKDREEIEDVFEQCETAFMGLQTIDVDWVQNLRITNGSGVAIMEGYSRDFLGFFFDLEISIIKYRSEIDRQ